MALPTVPDRGRRPTNAVYKVAPRENTLPVSSGSRPRPSLGQVSHGAHQHPVRGDGHVTRGSGDAEVGDLRGAVLGAA